MNVHRYFCLKMFTLGLTIFKLLKTHTEGMKCVTVLTRERDGAWTLRKMGSPREGEWGRARPSKRGARKAVDQQQRRRQHSWSNQEDWKTSPA
jgi:hypothetical protein